MKLNIAYPRNGTVKQFEVADEVLRRVNLGDYRLGNEVDGVIFGEPFKGYTFKLQGGSDKEGFPMVQGVMAPSRVSLLVKRGAVGFNTFRGYQGERRRKSLRGCILASDIAVLNVIVVRVGEQPIEGVTDVSVPRRLGPKRANKIRKLFNEYLRLVGARRRAARQRKAARHHLTRVNAQKKEVAAFKARK
ncbi:40S ribosomal protein S6, putative [Trypanosoma equiperdum]|uniref:40S ribosomal protein S6, putative n=1 Tax=Trypanosoma equiperdum TaxID=5694 RepID=A0A1G4I5N1_TRYEQ|nr:40S ribosomal protein S6, putative [Trypanosoma equiperdum]